MRKAAVVIALAGLACAGSGSSAHDADAPPPDNAVFMPDAGATADAAAPGMDTAVAADAGVDATPDAPAADVSVDLLPADATPFPDVPTAELDADMDAFFFGPTVIGCESPMPAVITVRNVSNVASGVLKVSLEGASPDRFRVDKDGCGGHSLAPAASCVVEVRFAPRQLGNQPLAAELVVGGGARESVTTSLSGEANLTHFDVFPWAGNAAVSFPSTAVGTTSAATQVVWTNTTDFAAMVGQPMLTGVAVSDFELTTNGCSGQTIGAHQTCQVGVRFKPTTTGQRSANLMLDATGACGYSFGDLLILSGQGQ